MAISANDLIARIREKEPGKNWANWCQLVAWYIPRVTGTPKDEIVTYATARDAYRASQIVSHDYNAAPVGAFHYWERPEPEGHVAFALGGGQALMASGVLPGDHLGVISVAEYNRLTGNPYLGWSFTNGRNPDIRSRFNSTTTVTAPAAKASPIEEEELEMVIIRNSKTGEIALVNPITGQKWRMPNPDYVRLWESRKWAKRLPDVPDNEFRHYLQMTAALGAVDSGYEKKLDEIAKLVK